MSELRLPRHGRNHMPTGSDPIPGLSDAIRYVVDNVGDWLLIETTDEIPSSDDGFNLLVHNGKDVRILADSETTVAGEIQIATESSNSRLGGLTLGGASALLAASDEDGDGGFVSIDDGGVTHRVLTAGGTHVFLDASGSPIFTLTG